MGECFDYRQAGTKVLFLNGACANNFEDSDKMVGMRLKEEDREYWDTRELSADLFFQWDMECFLKTLVAVSVEKLAELELI